MPFVAPPEVGFASSARPRILRRHIDGPVITYRDGQMHWLTWRERIALMFGRLDAMSLEYKRRPDLRHLHREG